MDPRRWHRINAVGYAIERLLARITVMALLVVVLFYVIRIEWSLLPDEALAEVWCSQELTASAVLSLPIQSPPAESMDIPSEWWHSCETMPHPRMSPWDNPEP